jgi:hypothetical protein
MRGECGFPRPDTVILQPRAEAALSGDQYLFYDLVHHFFFFNAKNVTICPTQAEATVHQTRT